jgi:hypothetical protein
VSILAKPALRMLNGVLTFYYGALNSSCYYGDSAPGGEAGGSRGVGDRGEPGPSLVPGGGVEVVAYWMAARRSDGEKGKVLGPVQRGRQRCNR